MSTFWIAGIVLNVSLTGLILYWLIKQAKPKSSDTEAVKPSPLDTDLRQSESGKSDAE